MHDVALVLDHVNVTDCPSVIGVAGAAVNITVGGRTTPLLDPPPHDASVTHTPIPNRTFSATQIGRIGSSLELAARPAGATVEGERWDARSLLGSGWSNACGLAAVLASISYSAEISTGLANMANTAQ